jgi:hypothetical protein
MGSIEPAQRECRDLAAVGAVQNDHRDRPVAVAERAHLEARVARRRGDAYRAWADEPAVARDRPQPAGGGDGVALDLSQSRVGAGQAARARAPQVEERVQVRRGQAGVDVLCPSES